MGDIPILSSTEVGQPRIEAISAHTVGSSGFEDEETVSAAERLRRDHLQDESRRRHHVQAAAFRKARSPAVVDQHEIGPAMFRNQHGCDLARVRPLVLADGVLQCEQVREVLKGARRVVVLEKSMAVGIGGILASDIRLALSELPVADYAVIAGLGGRSITKSSLRSLFESAMRDALEPLTFLDLDWTIVNRHLERERTIRRSGPAAENILRELGRGTSHIG